MEKRVVRLTESRFRSLIAECVLKILNESFGGLYGSYGNNENTATFILVSRANGNLKVVVPYREFMAAKAKVDYLWKKCSEQNTINVMGNGYFMVSPNDPHKEEIERWF